MLARSAIVACCLVLSVLFVRAASRPAAVPPHPPLDQLPMQIGGWHGVPYTAIDAADVAVLGVDEFVNRLYAQPGVAPVALYVGYYARQHEGDTIHSPLNCLPGSGWEPASRARARIAVGGRTIEVNRLTIEKGLDRQLVLYWYQAHGRVVASEYWGRAFLIYDAIRSSRTDGALVRVITPVTQGEAAGEMAATSFVQALFPELSRFLP